MFGEVVRIIQEMSYTQTKSQLGQGFNKRKSKEGNMRKNLLNRLKLRMLSALKGEQYR